MKNAANLASVPGSYGEVFGRAHSQGVALVEVGSSRDSIADECRHAALDFMAGVADGWTKFDLALWLHGPYSLAARHLQSGERVVAPVKRPIEDLTIEMLLVSTRGQLLAALELAVLAGGTPEFIEHALIQQHVRRAVDDSGECMWVPVDCVRMRLKDRVASLFVADYLNRPIEYTDLYVCHQCEAVTFDPAAKERGRCGAHRVSGIVPKARMRTLTYGE